MLVNGFVNVAITSLERRFDLKSTQSGFIASSYDMGSLLAVVPISNFGGLTGTSKPRYISKFNTNSSLPVDIIRLRRNSVYY